MTALQATNTIHLYPGISQMSRELLATVFWDWGEPLTTESEPQIIKIERAERA